MYENKASIFTDGRKYMKTKGYCDSLRQVHEIKEEQAPEAALVFLDHESA